MWQTTRTHLLGLCINDLPVHNFSRDSLFANVSHSKELEDRINAEMEKIKQIEASMKRLDVEKKVNDDLLSQMIPKKVMEKINSGKWYFYDINDTFGKVKNSSMSWLVVQHDKIITFEKGNIDKIHFFSENKLVLLF